MVFKVFTFISGFGPGSRSGSGECSPRSRPTTSIHRAWLCRAAGRWSGLKRSMRTRAKAVRCARRAQNGYRSGHRSDNTTVFFLFAWLKVAFFVGGRVFQFFVFLKKGLCIEKTVDAFHRTQVICRSLSNWDGSPAECEYVQ